MSKIKGEIEMVEKVDDINIFKINLFSYKIKITDENKYDSEGYKNYCIEHKVLGWGWVCSNGAKCGNSIETYYKDYKDEYYKSEYYKESKKKCTALTKAYNQIKPMQKDDFVWVRVDGKWYLGKISGDFTFCPPENYPEFGMLRSCEWKEINKDLVPGNILTYSKNDNTIRRIEKNDSFIKYCQYLYGDLKEKPQNLNFWDLAHYEDLEDIVGLYLQKEEGYLIFPSTNKMGTEDYEYMLIQKAEPYKKAIIQCKNNSCIGEYNWEKFEDGEYKDKKVYILTIKNDPHPEKKYTEYSETKIFKWSYKGRIFVFNPNELKKWAAKNKDILPERIKTYLEMSE